MSWVRVPSPTLEPVRAPGRAALANPCRREGFCLRWPRRRPASAIGRRRVEVPRGPRAALSMPPCVKIKVLLAASEVAGFAKTGGLADVAASLPRALAERGHECAVILPLYRSVRTGPIQIRPTGQRLAIPVGGRTVA